jgi:flavodoxin
MSETVVVFYSRTGKTRMVAGKLASLLRADLEEITEAKNRSGVMGFLGGAFATLFRRSTTLTSKHSIDDRSVVVLGMPVWADSPPPAIAQYVGAVDLSGRRVLAFCTHGGGGGKGTFRKLSEMLPVPLEESLAIKNPREDDPALEETLKEWVGRIQT